MAYLEIYSKNRWPITTFVFEDAQNWFLLELARAFFCEERLVSSSAVFSTTAD